MHGLITQRIGRAMLLAALLLTLSGAMFAQGKGGGGGVNAKGGGGVKPVPTPTPEPTPIPAPTPTPTILPSTPPAPDVIMRESFGLADGLLRPTGGKGTLKETYLHTSLTGFWVEYPGSKDTAWLAPSEGQTWRLGGSSDNPYEIFSPLQAAHNNGCIISDWRDSVAENPTALLPFKPPASAYEISINGYPAPIEGKYIALGLTGSSLLDSNLETSASVWLVLRPGPARNNTTVIYELRSNGMDGPVLASGETFFNPFNRLALRYDPLAKIVSASLNEIELGVFSQTIPTPKFIGIEGVGIVDNFVVRKLP